MPDSRAGASSPLSNASTTFRFSLKEIPERQRREVATEVAGRAIANLDLTPLTGDLQMEMESRLLPGVTIADTRLSPHRAESGYERSRDNDDFALHWCRVPAKGFAQQFGKEFGTDGSAVLLSCADRITCDTHETLRHVTVRLQRSVLLPMVPKAEAALMRPVPAENEALRLLTSYLDSLRALGHAATGADFAHTAAMHIADLVALAVGTNRDAAELASKRGLHAARLNAVKRWVLAQLGSPELSIRTAAAAAGLSPRSLQLLFEIEGTTFSKYVLRERLALAHRRLSMLQFEKRTIGEIAYDCGFGDLSHFTRDFRRVYGKTPSDVRSRALVSRH